MTVIGIDLGGTKLAAAILTERGKILERRNEPLAGRQGYAVGQLIQQQVSDLIHFARVKKQPVRAIGICVPGLVNKKSGNVWAPNIRGWDNYPLRKRISSQLKSAIPVVVESDRAAYVLGETWRGAARGCRNAIFIGVGTGIGAGILSNGEVLHGENGTAGSIGWLALNRPFQKKYVGCGCFEHYASGEGLAKAAREILAQKKNYRGRLKEQQLDARQIFAAFEKGDPVAKAVLRQAVEFWGMATANLVSLFDPQKIIFGGGVFGPAQRFLQNIRTEAAKWAQPISMKRVKLVGSQLGGNAGILGAGYLALHTR